MIQPGQTETVAFTSVPPQKSGPFAKEITVACNDRATPTLSLQGEATVMIATRKQPEVVNFSQIKRDTPEQKQTMTITRGDGGPLKPKISSIGNPQIKAELREIEAGEKYALDVTIAPPWPNGMLQGVIMLDAGVEQAPPETIHVFASVVPRFQAVPAQLMLVAEPKTDADMNARLSWDGEPGKILAVTTSDPATSAEVTEKDNAQFVVLHVPAGYNPQNKHGNIAIRTNDPIVPVLKIPFTVVNPAGSTPGQPGNLPGRTVQQPGAAQPLQKRPADTAPAQKRE